LVAEDVELRPWRKSQQVLGQVARLPATEMPEVDHPGSPFGPRVAPVELRQHDEAGAHVCRLVGFQHGSYLHGAVDYRPRPGRGQEPTAATQTDRQTHQPRRQQQQRPTAL
jgi:hypothetical protein